MYYTHEDGAVEQITATRGRNLPNDSSSDSPSNNKEIIPRRDNFLSLSVIIYIERARPATVTFLLVTTKGSRN